MSNPGVIYLAQCETRNGVSFRVEDNIGESIHLHYGEIRIDITIQGLLDIAETMNDALDQLLEVPGFSSKDYDPVFLHDIAHCLIDLERVDKATIKLNDILVQTVGIFGLPVVRRLKHSRVVKALGGNDSELNRYKQENLRGQSNKVRVDEIHSSIKKNGYPFKDQYIVLFNNQNMIRDGQHRAACLYYLEGGELTVPVIRLQFKNGMHASSEHPWVVYLFKWNKRRVKNLLRTIIKRSYRLLRAILSKCKNLVGIGQYV